MRPILKLAQKLKTPRAVQSFLRKEIRYNPADTQQSALTALRTKKAHCMEGAFIAAAILEHHGYPPLVMSLESKDGLDHVVFVFKHRGRWGAVGQSRDEGLYGRSPVYRSIRDLAWSYYDPYVDETGKVTSYQIAHLDDTKSQWRHGKVNQFKAERYLLELPHRKLRSSRKRHKKLRERHIKFGPMTRKKYWW